MSVVTDTATHPDPVTCWDSVLDELERLLDAQERCLGGAGNVEAFTEMPPSFVVPEHLGAMPAAVRGRAIELKSRNDELAARARRIEQSIQLTQQASSRRGARVRSARASFDEKF